MNQETFVIKSGNVALTINRAEALSIRKQLNAWYDAETKKTSETFMANILEIIDKFKAPDEEVVTGIETSDTPGGIVPPGQYIV